MRKSESGAGRWASPENAGRARLAEAALMGFVGATGSSSSLASEGDGEELTTTAVDLVADLMHLCDFAALNFDEIMETAKGHYDEEVREAGR